MGSCSSLEEEIDYGCGICHNNVGNQYIYCAYCNKRFHPRCIKQYKTIREACPNCDKNYMRVINKDLVRNKI